MIGESTSAACALGCVVCIVTMHIYLRKQNAKRDALTAEEREEWIQNGKIGDAHPDFRYII